MKKIWFMGLLSLLMLTACGGGSDDGNVDLEPLATPSPLATTSGTQAKVRWSAVANAASYLCEVTVNTASPTTQQVSVTEFGFTMTSGNKYRVRVKAQPGENTAYTESAWSSYLDFEYNEPKPEPEPEPTPEPQTRLWPEAEMDGVIRAFPGAEGGGMYTTGGRGGRVIHVTNLNDSGTGSLRDAVNQSGPRTIVFDVAGTIQLKSELRIKNGDVTIAGQTAPGDGITLRDYSVVITSSNVIIRYLRFRMGDAAGHEGDAIWGRYYQDIIIDHCSMSWSTDECASFYGNKNFTMQWCLIGESLRASIHGKGNHGYGGIWGGKNASFHHNILTAHSSRNPRFCHPQVYGNYLSTHRGHVDYRNNVVNNWGDNSSYGGESAQINMVNNLYKPGPASKDRKYFLAADAYYEKDGTVWSSAYAQLYVTGNVHTAHGDITSNNQSGINFTDGAEYANYQKFQSAPFSIKKDDSQVCYTTTQTASKAYDMTLDYAGASLKRDAVDVRLIDDARNGKATYTTGGNGSTGGMIDTQTAVGGWPTLTATDEEVKRATTDTDKDGIPDYYEEVLGLDKSKSDASQKTLDPQGLYTNFEAYLHFLVQHITSAQTAGGTYTKLE